MSYLFLFTSVYSRCIGRMLISYWFDQEGNKNKLIFAQILVTGWVGNFSVAIEIKNKIKLLVKFIMASSVINADFKF